MSKVRAKEYQVRIDHALATPKLQDALHKFGDAFLLAREKAFSQYDFEALRQEAVVLGAFTSENVLDGLENNIRLAKAINGLPK